MSPRSNRSARAAGQRFERSIANHLAAVLDDRIDIRPKNGTKDRGDIGGVRSPFGKVVLELKDHATLALPGWLREAEVERGNDDALVGVVVHKKRGVTDPGEQYVTMTVDSLVRLLGGPIEPAPAPADPVVIEEPLDLGDWEANA